MEAMREQWTDARLDDLNDRISYGFNRIDVDLRDIRAEIGSLSAETNARFDSLQRTMLLIGGGLIATLVAGIVSFLVVLV
jgi:hypothetical protein